MQLKVKARKEEAERAREERERARATAQQARNAERERLRQQQERDKQRIQKEAEERQRSAMEEEEKRQKDKLRRLSNAPSVTESNGGNDSDVSGKAEFLMGKRNNWIVTFEIESEIVKRKYRYSPSYPILHFHTIIVY